jgi:uncharacterized protein (TIGR02145 family)
MKYLKYTLTILIAVIVLLTALFSCENDNEEPPFVEQPLPSVSTREVTNIVGDAATFWGSISSDGGYTIIESGFCINISQNPTITNAIMIAYGVGTNESFTIRAGDFELNTTYYVCAFAKSKVGIAYGNQTSFTTTNGLPMITSIPISNITGTSAQSGGDITSNGGFSVTKKGVCWGTGENPTIESNLGYTTEGGTEHGVFTSNITGLTEWSTYYMRAYATNENGTSYGNNISFSTIGTSITDYDSNVYQIVQIGDQLWIAENLKTTHYADGTEIQLVESSASWNALGYADKAMCYYDNSSSNADNYGALYTWSAAVNGAESSNTNPSGVQGACPDDWHIPSVDEWDELSDYLNGELVAGGKLKETGYIHWNSPNYGATNETGFLGLPGGYRNNNGNFYEIGNYGIFWTASQYDNSNSTYKILYYEDQELKTNHAQSKNSGISIRCIKD